MTKFYIDTEYGVIVNRADLEEEFHELQESDPDTYGGITFDMYLANCTGKNGFLEEVVR